MHLICTQDKCVRFFQEALHSSGERIRRPWSTVDATYGYNNVGKKSSEQDVVIIMAARAGSIPALSTIAPLAHLVRAADS